MLRAGASVALAAALGLGAISACDSSEGAPPVSVSVAPPAAPAVPPEPPPTPKRPASFGSEDGAALAGDLYLASPEAPAIVFVHRLLGDRSEFAPLVERLRKGTRRFTLLAFDLRGHGASKEPDTKGKKTGARPKADKSDLAADVKAAIAHVLEAGGGKSRGVVLVGSSFGATLAALVAFEQPKVTALAFVSPGAAIRGVDLYRPYSEVRNLPTFVAGAENDNVAKDPLDALGRMGQKTTTKRYPGARHGAQFLAEEHQSLWIDLERFLASVHEQAPEERRSLYYAPGKEPKGRARGGS